MKVLICGGRDYANYAHAFKQLDTLHATYGIDMVIQGGAPGADAIAAAWAKAREINCLCVPAKWHTLGKYAGTARNNEMIDLKPDKVFSFPGGKGTAMMRSIAAAKGVEVIEL